MSWSDAVKEAAKAVTPSNVLAIVLAVCLVGVVVVDKQQMSHHLREIRTLYEKRLRLEETESENIRKLIEKLIKFEKPQK